MSANEGAPGLFDHEHSAMPTESKNMLCIRYTAYSVWIAFEKVPSAEVCNGVTHKIRSTARLVCSMITK